MNKNVYKCSRILKILKNLKKGYKTLKKSIKNESKDY